MVSNALSNTTNEIEMDLSGSWILSCTPLSRMQGLDYFELSAQTPPIRSSLVSPKAVRAMFSKGRHFELVSLIGLALLAESCKHAILLF
jgi:hypothetical protein